MRSEAEQAWWFGEDWIVDERPQVIDGDTVDLWRRRELPVGSGLSITLRDDIHSRNGIPVRVRLAWLNTPERGDEGWADARADLQSWVVTSQEVAEVLWVRCWIGEAGEILGDLWFRDEDGFVHSASQYMMACGWLPQDIAPLQVKPAPDANPNKVELYPVTVDGKGITLFGSDWTAQQILETAGTVADPRKYDVALIDLPPFINERGALSTTRLWTGGRVERGMRFISVLRTGLVD